MHAAAAYRKSIPQCRTSIQQVFRELARSKSFPTRGMSCGCHSGGHVRARTPGKCPLQPPAQMHETESGPIYTCVYTGAITVTIDGKQFTRTWWDMGGDTMADFSPVAKSLLGTWGTRYDDDRMTWPRSRRRGLHHGSIHLCGAGLGLRATSPSDHGSRARLCRKRPQPPGPLASWVVCCAASRTTGMKHWPLRTNCCPTDATSALAWGRSTWATSSAWF